MKLIITIDTEEDNWKSYSATDNPVSNIESIPTLQKLFDKFGVRPTYLLTYPVATNPRSVEILKRILEEGKCEIGMHCHPWNTPPFDEKANITARDTMLCNLPENLVNEKMSVLHETISKSFGIVPTSFRAGRWGFSSAVSRSLCLLGYKVDTSVTPFYSWKDFHGPDFSEFTPDLFRIKVSISSNQFVDSILLEVPVTIGFLQSDFNKYQRIRKTLYNTFARKLRLIGMMHYLGILNRTWLSPELSDAHAMIKLAGRMVENNFSWLNLSFHSTSLIGGQNNFVKKGEERTFLKRIEEFLMFCSSSGWESQTLSQVANSSEIQKTPFYTINMLPSCLNKDNVQSQFGT